MSNISSFSDWQILLLIIPYAISLAISIFLLWNNWRDVKKASKN